MEKLKNFLFYNSNTRQTIVKNTLWLFIGEISGRIFKMMLVVYAARNLGAEGWGVFSYTLSIAALFMIFSDVGIDDLITRELSQKKDNYKVTASAALAIKGTMLISGVILAIFVGPIISSIPQANNLFWLVAIILLFDAIRNNGFAINRVTEKVEKEAIIKFITNSFIFVIGYFLIKTNPTPMSLVAAYAAGGIIGAVLVLNLVRKTILEFIVTINKEAFLSVMKTIIPLTMVALMGSILANTDIFMLGLWKTPEDIGMYAAVQRFYQFIAVMPAMIITATLPLMSRLAINDSNKFKIAVEKVLTIFMVLSIPIVLGGLVLAKEIILLTFGSGYLQAVPVFRIVLVMSLAAFSSILFVNTIFVHNKQKMLVLINIIGAVVNVLLNFILIPKLGITGAAFSTLASTWVITYVTWQKMKEIDDFKIWPSLKIVLPPVLIMLLATLVFKYLGIGVLQNITISALIYSMFFFVFKKKTFTELKDIVGIQ